MIAASWRNHLDRWVNHPAFLSTVYVLIFANAVLIGLETYPALFQRFQSTFLFFDKLLLWAFTVEIAMRLLAQKSLPRFFTNGWNVFDFVIVLSGHVLVGATFVTVLRILRILRVLRAVSIVPSLRRIVNTLIMTIPSLGHISMLLGLLFYIYAVIGTMLYSELLPEYFADLQTTLLTLFQVVTLESWASGVMRPLLEMAPGAWFYFVSFVLLGTFIVMNLIVGVVVDNMDQVKTMEAAERAEKAALPHQQVKAGIAQQAVLSDQQVKAEIAQQAVLPDRQVKAEIAQQAVLPDRQVKAEIAQQAAGQADASPSLFNVGGFSAQAALTADQRGSGNSESYALTAADRNVQDEITALRGEVADLKRLILDLKNK